MCILLINNSYINELLMIGTSSECHYWSGTCSDDLLHCLLNCNGPTIPFTVLVEYSDGVFNTSR